MKVFVQSTVVQLAETTIVSEGKTDNHIITLSQNSVLAVQ